MIAVGTRGVVRRAEHRERWDRKPLGDRERVDHADDQRGRPAQHDHRGKKETSSEIERADQTNRSALGGTGRDLDRKRVRGQQNEEPRRWNLQERRDASECAERSDEEEVRVHTAVLGDREGRIETGRDQRAEHPHRRRRERRDVGDERVVRAEVQGNEQCPDDEEGPSGFLDSRDAVADEATAEEAKRTDDHESEPHGVGDLLSRDVHEDQGGNDDEERPEIKEQARRALWSEEGLDERRRSRSQWRSDSRRRCLHRNGRRPGRRARTRDRHRGGGSWSNRPGFELFGDDHPDAVGRGLVQRARADQVIETVEQVRATQRQERRRHLKGAAAHRTRRPGGAGLRCSAEIAMNGRHDSSRPFPSTTRVHIILTGTSLCAQPTNRPSLEPPPRRVLRHRGISHPPSRDRSIVVRSER